MGAVSCLYISGVDPEVGKLDVLEGLVLQVGHLLIQCPADAADLARAHLGDTEPCCYPLDLPGRDACGIHLRHGRHHGTVRAGIALDDVIGEVAPHAQLGYPHRGLADTGDEPALAVAVAGVAVLAEHVGLRGHDLVDERLHERSSQLPQIDHSVIVLRHRIG